jgi:hypothetical protein
MKGKYIFFNPVACFLYKAEDLSDPPRVVAEGTWAYSADVENVQSVLLELLVRFHGL